MTPRIDMNTQQIIKKIICTLSIFASMHSLAIHFEPIQFPADAGELFYAEIKYSHVQPQSILEVNLANAEDFSLLGLPEVHQPALNIFLRKIGDGHQGVIILTALQPMNSHQIHLLLKVKVDHIHYFQQFQLHSSEWQQHQSLALLEQPVYPTEIEHENEIALNRPQQPSMPFNPVTTTPFTALFLADPTEMTRLMPQTRSIQEAVLINEIESLNGQQARPSTQRYTVRRNESLSKIVKKIARQTHLPHVEVMQQLQRDNKHAFIQGNPDRLRYGASLYFSIPEKWMRPIP